MTMMDHNNVIKDDLTSQYFLNPESVGQNVSNHAVILSFLCVGIFT